MRLLCNGLGLNLLLGIGVGRRRFRADLAHGNMSYKQK
jgi:hypothetical protein